MKLHLHLLTLVLVHCCLLSSAQGLILDEIGYDTTPCLPLYAGEKGVRSLPKSLNLRVKYCPKPEDQGAVNSCVAFACGYGAYTILQAKNNSWSHTTATQNAYSPAYLFNLMGNMGGMTIPIALSLMKDKGICRATTFPYRFIIDRAKLDPKTLQTALQTAVQEANRFRIDKHFAVPKSIADIKAKLTEGLPVIIGAKVESYAKFRGLGAAQWWSPQNPTVNHAMLIVGYDDADDSFEIMNSYGTGWGNGGFIKIKQNDLVNAVLKEAYVMVLPNSKGAGEEDDLNAMRPRDSLQRDIVGVFQLRNFIGKAQNTSGKAPNTEGGDSATFESTKVFYNTEKQVYETHRSDWQQGEIFQFLTSSIPAHHYLYVFSLDAGNKLNVHWPPDARWAETDSRTIASYAPNSGQRPISALILSPKTQLTIPAPDEGLQVNQVGTDHLIVLVAGQPITDFRQRLNRFKAASGDAAKRIHVVFGDVLIPQNRLVYLKETMTVRRFTSESQGWVVPMLLTVTVR